MNFANTDHHHTLLLLPWKLKVTILSELLLPCFPPSMTFTIAASLCSEAEQSLDSLDPSNGIALVRIITIAIRKPSTSHKVVLHHKDSVCATLTAYTMMSLSCLGAHSTQAMRADLAQGLPIQRRMRRSTHVTAAGKPCEAKPWAHGLMMQAARHSFEICLITAWRVQSPIPSRWRLCESSLSSMQEGEAAAASVMLVKAVCRSNADPLQSATLMTTSCAASSTEVLISLLVRTVHLAGLARTSAWTSQSLLL